MNKEESKNCLRIYEENNKRINWYLRRKCSWLSEDDICDVMQEVWKALSENIHRVGTWNEASQWSWLASVAYKQAVNVARKNVRKQETTELVQKYIWQSSIRAPLEDSIIHKLTAVNILKKLSPKEREILFGDILKPDDPTVKKRKDNADVCKSYRARKKLEKHMKEGGLDD